MNTLMLLVVALVALCYFGGNYCPSVLKQNKEMLLGGAIALVLCSFFGMRLEGVENSPPDDEGQTPPPTIAASLGKASADFTGMIQSVFPSASLEL
jgi:hypothetical protein